MSNDSPQEFATSCLWNLFDKENTFKTGECSNIISDFCIDLVGNQLKIILTIYFPLFDYTKGNRDLTFELIIISNHSIFYYLRMEINSFFKTTSVKSMTGNVYHVICSCHNMEISSFIDESFVTKGIVSWFLSQIFFNISFIISP